ncbi:hypothetical protein EST45_25910 [Escherichia coli]|nr:hypothetical protein [Escherichia coli]
MTDFGGKTSIFSHPVYLFLRKFSLQDSRGGSLPPTFSPLPMDTNPDLKFIENGLNEPMSPFSPSPSLVGIR